MQKFFPETFANKRMFAFQFLADTISGVTSADFASANFCAKEVKDQWNL